MERRWGMGRIGWLCLLGSLCAAPALARSPATDVKTTAPDRPSENLLEMIPFFGDIPRNFLVGDGYRMKLSGQALRIDHMGYRARTPVQKRNCMIGLSYSTPVAG